MLSNRLHDEIPNQSEELTAMGCRHNTSWTWIVVYEQLKNKVLRFDGLIVEHFLADQLQTFAEVLSDSGIFGAVDSIQNQFFGIPNLKHLIVIRRLGFSLPLIEFIDNRVILNDDSTPEGKGTAYNGDFAQVLPRLIAAEEDS